MAILRRHSGLSDRLFHFSLRFPLFVFILNKVIVASECRALLSSRSHRLSLLHHGNRFL